jgi:RNA polymerase sigma factor (sigma-70 family)
VCAAKRGDPGAREKLIEAFMPRIAAVARLYRASPTVQRQELLQEGVVGLLEALRRYDPARGTPFWAYARWYVVRAMRRLVSELTRPVVLSDRALRQLGRLRDAEQRALTETGRSPSRDELAERAHVPRERAEELLRADRPPRSLQQPVHSGEVEPVVRLEDQLADPQAEEAYDRLLDQIEARELLALLSELSPRERMVLRARHGLDGGEQRHEQIGERLGLGGDRVRQIERRARRKLAAGGRAGTSR